MPLYSYWGYQVEVGGSVVVGPTKGEFKAYTPSAAVIVTYLYEMQTTEITVTEYFYDKATKAINVSDTKETQGKTTRVNNNSPFSTPQSTYATLRTVDDVVYKYVGWMLDSDPTILTTTPEIADVGTNNHTVTYLYEIQGGINVTEYFRSQVGDIDVSSFSEVDGQVTAISNNGAFVNISPQNTYADTRTVNGVVYKYVGWKLESDLISTPDIIPTVLTSIPGIANVGTGNHTVTYLYEVQTEIKVTEYFRSQVGDINVSSFSEIDEKVTAISNNGAFINTPPQDTYADTRTVDGVVYKYIGWMLDIDPISTPDVIPAVLTSTPGIANVGIVNHTVTYLYEVPTDILVTAPTETTTLPETTSTTTETTTILPETTSETTSTTPITITTTNSTSTSTADELTSPQNSSTPPSINSPKTPLTGIYANPALWILLTIISAIALVIIAKHKKAKEK